MAGEGCPAAGAHKLRHASPRRCPSALPCPLRLSTAQVGDVLDRGDAELRILLFLESLQAQARAAGGALHLLNGK